MDLFCYICFIFIRVKLSGLFLTALWLPGGKGLTSWLYCVLCFLVFYLFFNWFSGSGMVLDCTDS